MNKPIIFIMSVSLLAAACGGQGEIDRHALVTRNNPHVTEVNPLHSLNLGNGEFAVTLDATGLQTFPEFYSKGLSLGTYSEWGWHSFPNVEGYTEAETLEDHPLPGHPHGLYAVQNGFGMSERGKAAAEWVRANPHRLHLGNFGFEGMKPGEISEVDQTLDMWDGVLVSSFKWNGMPVSVETVCAADDVVAASVKAASPLPLVLRFPYPTGVHTDDASAWDRNWLHSTEVVSQTGSGAVLKRIVDDTVYYVAVKWTGDASFEQNGRNVFNLVPEGGEQLVPCQQLAGMGGKKEQQPVLLRGQKERLSPAAHLRGPGIQLKGAEPPHRLAPHARLLLHFAGRTGLDTLPGFEVPFRKVPTPVAVDQQPPPRTVHDHPAGRLHPRELRCKGSERRFGIGRNDRYGVVRFEKIQYLGARYAAVGLRRHGVPLSAGRRSREGHALVGKIDGTGHCMKHFFGIQKYE